MSARLWEEFEKKIGTAVAEKQVQSRAGKTSRQYIFASRGITASLKSTNVDFIEIYRPCGVQDYLKNFYKEPKLFIR